MENTPPPPVGKENENYFAYVDIIVIQITNYTPHPKLIPHPNPFRLPTKTFLVESCYKLFLWSVLKLLAKYTGLV